MSTWNKHYHWKTKGCTPWSKTWIKTNLVGQKANTEAGTVQVTALESFEGDVELGNRKGKLITIFDCAVTLAWADEEEKVKGTITFPEVCHEVEDEGTEYIHESALTDAGGKDGQTFLDGVRRQLIPLLLKTLHRFRKDLIQQHASDLGHDGLGTVTPAASSGQSDVPVPERSDSDPTQNTRHPSDPKKTSNANPIRSSSRVIRQSAHLAISRTDLWALLTDPDRIPLWTKAPAKFTLKENETYTLFGGNVSGVIKQIKFPEHLSHSWRLSQWPEGHFAELTIDLKEGTDSTELVLTLTAVPSGEEDRSEVGLETYYLRGLKGLGLGTIL
ncbi:hypothetical protein K437DRAFT_242350 [Tilletiaria anomala UBC 951]|uniref:Activator of Hsp90 ATPase AHSA1-like N-terminal domain-containing protein n=1 Tax=Tilletiaria anomala (strain ATCC 24038 / CBS 436.72 / UBC 951) TaxID=1037660 RepID=A0A066WHM2_TILAU|nr:uncharacterized protein K437DRAFT_242350 [Tilletiaria anomala UBC 951]KDN53301.1 hypothetical protein K437DRAFT_242350 [Tilletiaria anomala UBC 951]